MSLSGGATSGSNTNGTFPSASAQVSMRLKKWEVAEFKWAVGEGRLYDPAIDIMAHPIDYGGGQSSTYDYTRITPDYSDFTYDGNIDGADFLNWQQNLGDTDTLMRAGGNANLADDTTVDAVDLGAWRSQFGTSIFASQVPATHAVPEPSAPALIAIAGVAALLLAAGRKP